MIKESKIIGIDIDGTLNNLCESVLSVYNLDSGDNLQVSAIKEYYVEKFVKEEYKQDFYKYFLDKRVWKSIKINESAKRYINILNEKGYKIYFVTSTEADNVKKKSNWLKRNFPDIDIRKRLIVCHDKQLLSSLDYLVDDYEKNLIGGKYKKILLSYPWNESFDCESNDIYRAFNWDDVYKFIIEDNEVENDEI